jgi:hypothetical protein
MDIIRRVQGIFRAVVVDNKDPLNLRRLKVRVSTTGTRSSDQTVTNWIWPVISTKRPPAINTGVYVMYVGGDPEYPVWIGEFGEEPQGVFAYGSWSSNSDLTTSINTPTAVPLNTTSFEEGVKLQSSSRLVVEESGVYNIQFSAQLHNTGGGGSGTTMFIWFRKNGADIANSATSMDVSSNTYEVVTVNLFEKMQPDDYFQVYWSTTNANIRIEHLAANSVHPAIPSIIVTVNQIA